MASKEINLVTDEDWLASHPYLQPLADLQRVIDIEAKHIPPYAGAHPNWSDFLEDFKSGVPALKSRSISIDLGEAEAAWPPLLERLISRPLPPEFAERLAALRFDMNSAGARHGAIGSLLDRGSFVASDPGFFQFLGWTVLARHLRPLVLAFALWREEDRWVLGYCPFCGSAPAMAQLSGIDPGKLRRLQCGYCNTRWRFLRTGCPFCENSDGHKLAGIDVEGEGGLRIDYCEACNGYLKTYHGEGNEALLLADWTSLHLDVIASDRSLKRLAASLYSL
jgi:FdhE protein